MLIENEFTVATPVDELWAYLLDVERIAPCMPGAELTETIDEQHWKGKVNMKFGPVALSFAGTVQMTERDDEAHRAVLTAKGMEARGKGAANATVTSWLEPAADGETTVKMTADITLTGAAAQLSRGLLPEISKKLTQQFADCLEATMNAERAATPAVAADTGAAKAGGATPPSAAAPAPVPVPATHVGGIGLGLSAVWALIRNFFRRLFGGGTTST
jgi:carbon monoxide dehydrogenase subunit G